MYIVYAKPQVSNMLKSISHLNQHIAKKGCNEAEMLNINQTVTHLGTARQGQKREGK